MNLVIRTCKYCNQTFLIEHGSFANHVRYCKKNNSYNHKKCLNKLKNKAEERYGKIKTFTVICFRCGTLFQVSEKEKLFPQKEKYFCNKSCSNSGRETSWSEKSKKDLSKKMSPMVNAAAADPLIKKPDKLNKSSSTLGKILLLVSI